jgi:hypothetical protein
MMDNYYQGQALPGLTRSQHHKLTRATPCQATGWRRCHSQLPTEHCHNYRHMLNRSKLHIGTARYPPPALTQVVIPGIVYEVLDQVSRNANTTRLLWRLGPLVALWVMERKVRSNATSLRQTLCSKVDSSEPCGRHLRHQRQRGLGCAESMQAQNMSC